MNQILVKIKRTSKYVKLMSDESLFHNIDLEKISSWDYSPETLLADGEWYKIENFCTKDFCIDLLKNEFDSKAYNLLEKNQFDKISYIVSVQDGDFYFQKITPGLFIKKKNIFFDFGNEAIIENSTNRLFINEIPDAVYFKEKKTLIFRKLATISSIFKGIDQLYREATNSEVENFLNNTMIQLDNYSIDNVSIPNRRRISLAMDTLNSINDDDKKEIITYIEEYCVNQIKFDSANQRFTIKTDDDLKLFLFGIEQRFYTTRVGEEKRIANSIVKLS